MPYISATAEIMYAPLLFRFVTITAPNLHGHAADVTAFVGTSSVVPRPPTLVYLRGNLRVLCGYAFCLLRTNVQRRPTTVCLNVPVSISSNLAEVQCGIAAAAERAGRDPANITLMAVTKTFSPDDIRQAY